MAEVHAERSNPWPFIGISVLVILLAAFLYLRMAGQNEMGGPVFAPGPFLDPIAEPAVIEEENGEEEGLPESRQASHPEKEAIPGQETPEEKRAVLVKKANDALSNHRFEEALSALAGARKIRASKNLDELEKKISTARKAFAKEQEERDRFAAALLKISNLWEKEWKKKNLWETARKQLEALEKEYPLARKDSECQALRKVILGAYSDYSGAFKANIQKAKKLHEGGSSAQALSRLRIALSLFPERKGEVDKLRYEWEAIVHRRNMIRVSDIEVQIGDDNHADEKPVRSFRGKVFWIDQYEVSNEEYAAFLISNPDHPTLPPGSGWRGRTPPKGFGKHPVTFVSYSDAEAYARWSKKRLPTAEEWEKAARFLKGGTWPWGDFFPPPGSDEFFANSLEYWQRFKARSPGPTKIGSFPKGKGELDLYDMAGNVWEWTSTKVAVEKDGKKVELVVLKGGSFMTSKEALRSSNRLLEAPQLIHPDTGFRCVRD